MTKICVACNREFVPSSRHRKCPKCRNPDLKTNKCAVCGIPIRAQNKTCSGCVNQKKENNGNWKQGRTRHHAGYLMHYAPEHPRANGRKYVFQHILVMEDMLGRYLLPDENVHHVNGIKDDNRPENLELWCRPQPSGIRVRDAVSWAREILGRYGNEF